MINWREVWTKTYRTMCQSAVAMLIVFNTIYEVDWKAMVGTVVLAGLVTALTNIGGAKYDSTEEPTIDDNEQTESEEDPKVEEVVEH